MLEIVILHKNYIELRGLEKSSEICFNRVPNIIITKKQNDAAWEEENRNALILCFLGRVFLFGNLVNVVRITRVGFLTER